MSARSDVSSLDGDFDRPDNYSFGHNQHRRWIAGDSLTGSHERRSRRLSRSRSRPANRTASHPRSRPSSRNFSRPARTSPSSSTSDDVDDWPKGRRTSNDEKEMVPSERPQRTSPDFTLAPFSVNNNPPLPPFAPKAVLRPPPVHPATPPPTAQKKRRATSTRSMDVMEAAKQAPWIEHGASTRSLLSTIKEKSAQQPSTFAQRVFEAGKPDLLYELTERKRLKMRSDGVLDLTTLERMNQHVLQQKLVEQVKALGERGAWMEIGVQQTLHDYCESLRDMEYMEQCALRGKKNDPFLLSTSRPMDCKLLEDAGLAFGDPKKKLNGETPDRLAYTKRESFAKRGLRRLLMAFLGGLAIVAPFLVMFLVSGQLVRLIATCAFTVAFAACATIGSEFGPDRIALVTAAYAAALVVFVGTNPPSYRY